MEQPEARGQQQPPEEGADSCTQPERLTAKLRAQKEALEAEDGGAELTGQQEAGGEHSTAQALGTLHFILHAGPCLCPATCTFSSPRAARLAGAASSYFSGSAPQLKPASHVSHCCREPASGTRVAQSTTGSAPPTQPMAPLRGHLAPFTLHHGPGLTLQPPHPL